MNVLITGCASGFGRALVSQLLKEGWTVLATLRDVSGRENLFQQEKSVYGDRLRLLELDVTSATDRARIVDLLQREYGGKLDALVNNAGYGLFGAFEDVSEKQIRELFEVNFFGLVLLTRALLPALRNSDRGRLVNLSSVFGISGFPLTSLYSASKFAVAGFSESLRVELEPFGIQTLLVEPGGHRTKFSDKVQWSERSFKPESLYVQANENYAAMRKRLASQPRGRTAESVAVAISRELGKKKMRTHLTQGKDAAITAFFRRSILMKCWEWIVRDIYRSRFLKPSR